MPDEIKVVTVSDENLQVRVAPGTALRTAWKTSLLQGVSLTASLILLILSYLQTLDISHILTPTQAVIWVAIINIAQLALRAYGVKPIVLDNNPKESQ